MAGIVEHQASRITSTPGICGGSACVANTRIPVWILVNWHHRGLDYSEILESYPDLTRDDIAAVFDYYRDHTNEIDREIERNQNLFKDQD